eukprot:maker-scaffold82_size396747-snap-gene-2.37 protein:Tk06834 transcript:maker-scaffold82_size396747-snap-gene-2.37-mRNA-1 annotation:"PREDICTED: contactin-5-like"
MPVDEYHDRKSIPYVEVKHSIRMRWQILCLVLVAWVHSTHGNIGSAHRGMQRDQAYPGELLSSLGSESRNDDDTFKSKDLQKLKWWDDVYPSRLRSSRLPHNKRPPNLLSPGVFNFKTPKSTNYYFHETGARIIKSSHFMKRYHLGRKISFVCVARGVPRPHITWLKDGLELNSYAGYAGVGLSEWRHGEDIVKSKLEIDPAMPKDAGFYECLGDNKFSIDRRGFIAKYELN